MERTRFTPNVSEGMVYRSSFTMPVYRNGEFIGFLFFNSREKGAFDTSMLSLISLLGHLLSLMVIDGLATPRALAAVVRATMGLARHRNFETCAHMTRVAQYSRFIAREVASLHRLTDAQVEHIFLSAPLHDIGKIGIPDAILRKRDKLSEEEFRVMKTHTVKGKKIVDTMLENFGVEDTDYSSVPGNITLYHHEAIDGSGYPHGHQGDVIPLEARIVAVADVFDALTSWRPYKDAWSIQRALEYLTGQAKSKFDDSCVAALVAKHGELESIRKKFADDSAYVGGESADH